MAGYQKKKNVNFDFIISKPKSTIEKKSFIPTIIQIANFYKNLNNTQWTNRARNVNSQYIKYTILKYFVKSKGTLLASGELEMTPIWLHPNTEETTT